MKRLFPLIFALLCARAEALPPAKVSLEGQQTRCVRVFLPATVVDSTVNTTLSEQEMSIRVGITDFSVQGMPAFMAKGLRKIVEMQIRSQFGSDTVASSLTHTPGVHDEEGEVSLSLSPGATADEALLTLRLRYNPELMAKSLLTPQQMSALKIQFAGHGSVVEEEATASCRFTQGNWQELIGGYPVALEVLDHDGAFARISNTGLSEKIVDVIKHAALRGAEPGALGQMDYIWSAGQRATLSGSLGSGFTLSGPLHTVRIKVSL